jgi:hypothetical protein
MKEHQHYFGKKFYKRPEGYWGCTRDGRILAHRWVWTMFFGEIPKGMNIHHIDHDRSNNEITNLQMLDRSTHMKYHWRKKKFNPRQLWLPI